MDYLSLLGENTFLFKKSSSSKQSNSLHPLKSNRGFHANQLLQPMQSDDYDPYEQHNLKTNTKSRSTH